MSEWKKVKIGDICRIVKGTTGIASAEPGEYPLVVTAEERKTCSSYQFDQEAVCIPLVSSSGHGKKSLKNVHYQSGKFALGTILCAVIPNNPEQLDARFLHQYLQFYKDTILVPLMKGAANVSLSMKDIATVEIPLPPIEKQRELSSLFITLRENQKKLAAETEKQLEYTKLLRQNILQDAIEGKLTADLPCRQAGWRKHSFKNLSGKLVSEFSDKYFAYVLECDDGSLYKGFTQNLFERINRHLEGRGSEWTSKHIPVSLIYFEEFDTEKEALEREKYFKSGSGREYINEIRNRNKLDYDAEALFEKIQEGKASPLLQPARRSFAAPSARDTPATPPFEIPEEWKTVKLDDLFSHKTGKTLNSSTNKGTVLRKYITTSNLYWNYFDFSKVKEMYFSDEEIEKYSVQKGDLLVCEGGDVGRSAIWNYGYSVCYQNHIHRLRAYYPINTKFYYYILYLYKMSGYIESLARGMGIQGLSANRLGSFLLPLPPLKEQEEIVAKVEILLAKVTELENQIQERKVLSEKLAFGIIKEKLEGVK